MVNIHSQASPLYMYKFIFHNYSCRFPLCSAPALELESDTGNGLWSPVYTDSLIPLVYFMLSPSSPFSLGYRAQCLHLRGLKAACAWSRYRQPPSEGLQLWGSGFQKCR